jgi:hypothetical protein
LGKGARRPALPLMTLVAAIVGSIGVYNLVRLGLI